jgi:glycosyltransferase involved in cell wall biosynthesis
MRILLICEAFHAVGGVVEVVDHLARDLIDLGHRAAVVSSTASEAQRVPRAPVDYIELEIPIPKPVTWRHLERLFRQPKGFLPLVETIREWKPDVVHSHGGVWDKFPVIVAACRQAGVPLVQSLHGTSYHGRLGEKALRALDRVSAITAASAYVRDFFARRVAVARRARVIRGGVDFAAAAAAVAPEHGRPYLICAARFHLATKALDLLVEVFAALASKYSEFDLLLAGDGHDRSKVMEQVSRCGLGARVMLPGALPQPKLWSLYRGATLFVMPSRVEEGGGPPLAILEAMACGLPVIVTNGGGTPEAVTDGVNGLLVERDDPAQFAAAISKLLDDPKARLRMGLAALESAAKYDWHAASLSYLEVYEACARRGDSRRRRAVPAGQTD